ncbi:MAG: rhodanese-like domain-containing protein [Desulfobacteraceae bacterium]|nr:rhodanese-like domain-containing protein [Desulfobacteraceae bacterium]
MSTGKYAVLYDVRTPAEYENGHIEQARPLPLTDLLNQAPDIPKDGEVIVTCGVGYRGNIAASFLQSEGFDHVHSLAGGMSAWRNSGGAVI